MSFDLQAHAGVQTGPMDMRFSVECATRGYDHVRRANWPAHPDLMATDVGEGITASAANPNSSSAIWDTGDGLVFIEVIDGSVHVNAAAASPDLATSCLERTRELLPAYVSDQPSVVPVTFWTASPHGGQSIRRDIDAEAWAAVEANYPRADGLADLMSPGFRRGFGGQLVLWHGVPGTGKTTALRALAREWRDWCDLHYIVDPDVFFGSRADYMMQVLTGHHELVSPGEAAREPRWRLLVLEDCGEMLQPDAKREVGQAVARLLNACDGLIGRGLRILVLLTTNEPVEKLHEAVARPGRCASLVEFGTFPSVAARAWLEHHGVLNSLSPECTLADLYGIVNDFRGRRPERRVGFAA